MYPKNRQGDEYYPEDADRVGWKRFSRRRRVSSPFYKEPWTGYELYARDRQGRQIYPRGKEMLFAQDRWGRQYYAKDTDNNEYYPIREGRSQLITVPEQKTIRLAQDSDGRLKYPVDENGNEYYLKQADGSLIVLQNEFGAPYWAKTRSGLEMIPIQYAHDESNLHVWDADENLVAISGLREDSNSALKKISSMCSCHSKCRYPSINGWWFNALLNVV